ncbi:MAG: (E)-4-hydroxy-3-methylbut-2-enyl-diphosphate synthase [bacterium]|nr:(E)-4-hydroxy-3-methylbut-2-enyl-diphosphate synthase [bacterium]
MKQRMLLTKEVAIGDLVFGGRQSIVRQTMTSIATDETEAVYRQIMMLASEGVELIRLTVQSPRIAETLEPLCNLLERGGIKIPLAADIHFSPDAALRAADFVEKIRINPGNFADRGHGDSPAMNDDEYLADLERVRLKFAPLVEKCRKLGRVMRIGVNHGSLSGRILNRYGDTTEGMVESALEYVRIAEELEYSDLILSMKASNVVINVEANRLLALRMLRRSESEGHSIYPIHLGVTEAGQDESGRIKSYVGMGALLEMGIGDTVRVSLTEDPLDELPATRALAERYSDHRRIADPWTAATMAMHFEAGECDPATGELPKGKTPVCVGTEAQATHFPVTLVPMHWSPAIQDLLSLPWRPLAPDHIRTDGLEQPGVVAIPRGATVRLSEPKLEAGAKERTYLEIAISVGVPLLERRAHHTCVVATSGAEAVLGTELAYSILQATRLRMTQADFISCPSCGRTNFDLEEVTRRIKERFIHLRGVKIAIMGCIVNGPGEMADADFGFVGSGKDKIDLYVGHDCVQRGIPSEDAVEQLRSLMEAHGVWAELC